MSRHIDADALIERLDDVGYGMKLPKAVVGLTKVLIDDFPSIDIVRCKECRYKDMDICPMYTLVKAGVRKPNDFCSYGSRSEKPNNLSDIPTDSERGSE